MALTNSQYETILRKYERRQLAAMRLMNERKEEIYEKVPEYKEIDQQIAGKSVELCKKKILGEDPSALEHLTEIIDDLTTRKKLLMTQAGYSINYLEPVYVCPDCKDTGFIEGEKCHCFRQAELNILYERSNIKEQLKDADFSRIRYDYQTGDDLEHFRNAVNISQDFVEHFESDYQNILFYGPVGTGKTMLSNCIAKEIMNANHSCIYFSAIALFEQISEYIFHKSDYSYAQNPLDELYGCDLLIIDDLGTEFTNNFVLTQLFDLLNGRIIRKKATIISSNLTFTELRDRYTDRIFSRIISNYQACKFSGEDVRISIARNKLR